MSVKQELRINSLEIIQVTQQGTSPSGRIRVGLGTFGTALIDNPNMRPFQFIQQGTGSESDW
jgi:hypothetical protein